jgi:hypothetical protein
MKSQNFGFQARVEDGMLPLSVIPKVVVSASARLQIAAATQMPKQAGMFTRTLVCHKILSVYWNVRLMALFRVQLR